MTNTKVANTKTLNRLITTARVLDLNRVPSKDVYLSTNGIHVLSLLLEDHKGFKNKDVIHHRVNVMAKVSGTEEPIMFILDIRAEDWDNLVDAKAMADSVRELNV
jgi:hypothetical protein